MRLRVAEKNKYSRQCIYKWMKFINLYSGTWIKGINEGLIFSTVYSEIKTQYICGILTKQTKSKN